MKDTFVFLFNSLASDPVILTLLDLVDKSGDIVEKQIIKSKLYGELEDNKPKICIWEPNPEPFNSRVERRFVQLDIYVPRERHNQTGLGYDLADRTRKVYKNLPVGTGLAEETCPSEDKDPPQGWYRVPVKFGYNFIKS